MKKKFLSLLIACAVIIGTIGTTIPAMAAEVPSIPANMQATTENQRTFTNEVHTWDDIATLSRALKEFVVRNPGSSESDQNKFLIAFVKSGNLKQKESLQSNFVITPDYYVPGLGDLNGEEIKLAASNPVNAVKAYNDANRATDLTIENYGKNGWQDNSDAFRHCLWSALMKRSIGTSASEQWGSAHEADSSGIDKQMDLFNNGVGRSVNVSGSETSVVNSVRSLVRSGRCRRIVSNRLVATDGSGLK